jgi:hypothetical protein
MKKNGKSTKPHTGKCGTPHAKASEPVNFKWSPQELKSLEELAPNFRNIDYSFREKLESCRRRGEKLHECELKCHKELHMTLAEIYEIHAAAYARDSLGRLREEMVPLCALRNYKPTRASNDFLIMIRAFTRYNKKRASDYAKALRFVLYKGIKADALVEFFKNEMGVDKCTKEFKKLNPKKTLTAKTKKPVDGTALPTLLDGYKSSMIKLSPKLSAFFEKEVKMGERKLTITGPLEQDGTIIVQRLVSEPTEASKAIMREISKTPMPKSALRKRVQTWIDTGR